MKPMHTERLQQDLHAVANDIEHLLHEVGDSAGERAGEVGQRLREVRQRLQRLEERTAEQVRETSGQLDDYVRERPWTAIGIAAGVAFVLGLLSRGRGDA